MNEQVDKEVRMEQLPEKDILLEKIKSNLEQEILLTYFSRKELIDIQSDLEDVLVNEWNNLGTHLENRISLITELYLRKKLISKVDSLEETIQSLKDENIDLKCKVQTTDPTISDKKREFLLHLNNPSISQLTKDMLSSQLVRLEAKEERNKLRVSND